MLFGCSKDSLLLQVSEAGGELDSQGEVDYLVTPCTGGTSRHKYKQHVSSIWLEDCFVVKYEASGQPGLGRHADDSELSFNLLLSDPASFDGGGTAFADADPEERTVCPSRGEVLTHFGRVMHEGKPTTGGAPRYILAGFVRARPLAEEWKLLRSTNENASPDGGGPE